MLNTVLRIKVRWKERVGFTLVELLVTVSVLVILSLVAIAASRKPTQKGRDTKREADLNTVRAALERYYLDQSPRVFPNPGSGSADDDYVAMVNTLIASGYLGNLSQDPQAPTHRYEYRVSLDQQCFELSAMSETQSGNFLVCGGDYRCRIQEAFCSPGFTPIPTLTPS